MSKRFPIILFVICAVAFALGLAQLFKLRFDAGDVYPGYSSLRADPLGTMAFFESLERMSDLSVRRDFSSANRLPEEPSTTYLHLAARFHEWHWLPEELFNEIESFLARGGRLVITFLPESGTSTARFRQSAGSGDSGAPKNKEPASKDDQKPGDSKSRETEGESTKGETKAEPTSPEKTKGRRAESDPLESPTSVKERWGVELGIVPLAPGDLGAYEPEEAANMTDLPLPETLDWHSGIVLTNLGKSWRVIYARGTNAVMAERKFGVGTVLIATDSYFLSNEALRENRQPALLSWLIGASRQVVFDEAHLGIMETAGVATLMRKYRLHGFAAGLLLLAGLFIWKNSVSLVPPHVEAPGADFVRGKDAASGFVNLLRRNVPARDLLRVCFDEWTKSLRHSGNYTIAAVDQAQTVMEMESSRPARAREPVKAYREICSVLKTTRRSTTKEHQ